mmetsp:Transcript_108886/g.188430  ORF Transcript_108886/g.188430 Transcript_108886/m.188430 type:complete len:488 (-) Transcript_108886:211-1674(-)
MRMSPYLCQQPSKDRRLQHAATRLAGEQTLMAAAQPSLGESTKRHRDQEQPFIKDGWQQRLEYSVLSDTASKRVHGGGLLQHHSSSLDMELQLLPPPLTWEPPKALRNASAAKLYGRSRLSHGAASLYNGSEPGNSRPSSAMSRRGVVPHSCPSSAASLRGVMTPVSALAGLNESFYASLSGLNAGMDDFDPSPSTSLMANHPRDLADAETANWQLDSAAAHPTGRPCAKCQWLPFGGQSPSRRPPVTSAGCDIPDRPLSATPSRTGQGNCSPAASPPRRAPAADSRPTSAASQRSPSGPMSGSSVLTIRRLSRKGSCPDLIVDWEAFREVSFTLGLLMHFKNCFHQADPRDTGTIPVQQMVEWADEADPSTGTSREIKAMLPAVGIDVCSSVDWWEFVGLELYLYLQLRHFSWIHWMQFVRGQEGAGCPMSPHTGSSLHRLAVTNQKGLGRSALRPQSAASSRASSPGLAVHILARPSQRPLQTCV